MLLGVIWKIKKGLAHASPAKKFCRSCFNVRSSAHYPPDIISKTLVLMCLLYQKSPQPSKARGVKVFAYLIISNLLVIVDQIVFITARKPYSAKLTELKFTPVVSAVISALSSVCNVCLVNFKREVHTSFKILVLTVRDIVAVFIYPIDKTDGDTVFSLLPTIPSRIRLYLTLDIFCHTYQNTSFLLQSLIFRLLIYL